MQSDNGQDASGRQSRCSDHYRRQVRSDRCNGMPGSVPQFGFIAPSAQERRAAGNQHGQWQSDQKDPEADARALSIPGNYLLGGASRLVLCGLQVADKEGGHEEGSRKDEEQFRGSHRVLA